MKNMLLMALVTMTASLSVNVMAGEATVKWQNPDDYRDIHPANEHKKHFRERLFSNLEEYISKLAKDLPEDISLELTFTDVNLAGDVQYSFDLTREVREVSKIHWPAMTFDVVVKKGNDKIISETVELKDMGFMSRGGVISSSRAYKYEKRMLKEWFRQDLTEMLAKYEGRQDDVMTGE